MEMVHKQKFLVISLFVVMFGILITNMISEETAIVFASWTYVLTAGSVLVLAIMMMVKLRGIGSHGKSWILFAGFAITWFVAEQLRNVNELILDIDSYLSVADFFLLLGYPFYFGFLMYYIKPFRKAISKKMVLFASLLSFALLVPSVYISYEMGPTDIENSVGFSYPIMDAIVFVPTIVGVLLFFNGKVNLMWTLMCLGILATIAAHTGFLFITLEETYHFGHPVEILSHWHYILFAFGIYGHYKIFRLKKTKVQKENHSIGMKVSSLVVIAFFAVVIVTGSSLQQADAEKASGNHHSEILSSKVCGNTLCEIPMSTQEKIMNYLFEKFETGVLDKATKSIGMGGKIEDSESDLKDVPTPKSQLNLDDLSPQELYEKMQEISPELIHEMYKADVAAERGSMSDTVKHLEQAKFFL